MIVMNTKVALAIFIYYWCIQLLFLQVSSTPASNGSDSTSCTSPVMKCANLGNISYPFWGSASCAASPTYAFSNCSTSSTSHAYWESFSAAQQGALRPPHVVDLSQAVTGTRIGLTWDTSFLNLDVCASPLIPFQNLSQYNIPASINLTGFANSTFQFTDPSGLLYFSPRTSYLLFNCTNHASLSHLSSQLYDLTEEGDVCTAYKQLCTSLVETSCINLQPHMELMLQHVMDTLSCSSFTFGRMVIGTTFFSNVPTITQWNTGVVQLFWTDNKCKRCSDAGGTCVFDIPLTPSRFLYCKCSQGGILDFNTQSSCHPVCYDGFMQCHPIFHIVTSVAVPLLAVLLLLLAIYFRGKIRKAFSMKLAPIAITVLKKTVKQLQALSYRPSDSFKYMDLEGLTERPVEYSYSFIASATKSFSSVVGEGGFGVVYKGMLPAQASTQRDSRKCQIAVKVLEMRSRHSKKQFLNEVVTIGRIHHLNVVRLLGFCMQEGHEMLVYEYVANGSLDKWLFDNSGKDEKPVLDWGQRYAIAVGIAKGLSYLHEECRHRTVHCDIKPHNILLDEEMRPKIADFGLARLMGREESQVVTFAKGTPGYMAPEFWMGGESWLSTKFDVYSYGMVLLELMSGCRNFKANGHCFPAVAFEAAMQGDFDSILDARLGITMSISNTSDEDEAQRLQRNQIRTAAFTALWCIQDQPVNRPCMSEVVQYLDGVAAVPKDPPQPTISISSTSIPPHKFSNTPTTHQHDFTSISLGR